MRNTIVAAVVAAVLSAAAVSAIGRAPQPADAAGTSNAAVVKQLKRLNTSLEAYRREADADVTDMYNNLIRLCEALGGQGCLDIDQYRPHDGTKP